VTHLPLPDSLLHISRAEKGQKKGRNAGGNKQTNKKTKENCV
jgi:hypothetical protein